MEIKRIEIDAKLIITIQSEKKIVDTTITKAILLSELNINDLSDFCLLGDGISEETKVLYSRPIKENANV